MLPRLTKSIVLNTVLVVMVLVAANFVPANNTYAGGRAGGSVVRDSDSYSYNYNMVQRAQRMLTDLGYKPGPVDGIWGPITSGAVLKYQEDNNLSKTGELDTDTKKQLFNTN